MRRRCCRPTIRATASTTSPTCSACRRRCSSAICRRADEISALAVGDPAIGPSVADLSRPRRRRRRSSTSKACRSARAAASLVQPDVPARRRVRLQGEAARRPTWDRSAGSSIRSSSRSSSTASACTWRRSAARPRTSPRPENATDVATASTRGCTVRVPVKAGPHAVGVDVPAEDAGARRRPAAAVRAEHVDHDRSHGPARISRASTIAGPVQRDRRPATRRAAGGSSCCRPLDAARTRGRAPGQILVDAGAARVSAAGRPRPSRARCCVLREAAAQRRHVRRAASSWRCARMLASPKFVFRVERDPASVRRGRVVSHQRPRAGVAAVVLPLEQHSRRRAARRWRARAG